jgi:hypothetical protein
MFGFASRRDFHEWLGEDLAQFVRKAIGDQVRKADDK